MNPYWGIVKVYGLEGGEKAVIDAMVFAKDQYEAKEKAERYYNALIERKVIKKVQIHSFYTLKEPHEEILDSVIYSPVKTTIFDSIKNPGCKVFFDMKELY